jgi:ABC-type polysaccharide/polyol phosphate export permease
MFHRQVKLLDIYISRILLEAAGATISLVLLTTIATVLGVIVGPADYGMALLGWFMLFWYAVGLSLLVGAVSERVEIVERVFHIFQYLMIPLSGSFFTVSSLPLYLQPLVLLNPTVHCTEMFREGFFGAAGEWQYEVGYVIKANALITLLGLIQVRAIARRVIVA